MAQRLEYRRRRDAEKAALMPRIVKKITMIDPETSQTWNSGVPGSENSARLI